MMVTPCWPSAGPTGGAGFAAPAWICSLMTAASFFFGGIFSLLLLGTRVQLSASPRSCPSVLCEENFVGDLDLCYLAERQLDRRLAAEDRHEHMQLLVDGVDL